MARTALTKTAKEKSTYLVVLTFLDETGAPVIPDSVAWTLTTLNGTVVNGRSAVVASPSSSVNVVLSNADLALLADETRTAHRLITVQATYSSNIGNSLPINDEYEFEIDGIVAIV